MQSSQYLTTYSRELMDRVNDVEIAVSKRALTVRVSSTSKRHKLSVFS